VFTARYGLIPYIKQSTFHIEKLNARCNLRIYKCGRRPQVGDPWFGHNLTKRMSLETRGLGTVARHGCHVKRVRFLILNQVFAYCALSKFTLATIRSKSADASYVYRCCFICQKPVCTVYAYWVGCAKWAVLVAKYIHATDLVMPVSLLVLTLVWNRSKYLPSVEAWIVYYTGSRSVLFQFRGIRDKFAGDPWPFRRVTVIISQGSVDTLL
jgi:hypothetical protein